MVHPVAQKVCDHIQAVSEQDAPCLRGAFARVSVTAIFTDGAVRAHNWALGAELSTCRKVVVEIALAVALLILFVMAMAECFVRMLLMGVTYPLYLCSSTEDVPKFFEVTSKACAAAAIDSFFCMWDIIYRENKPYEFVQHWRQTVEDMNNPVMVQAAKQQFGRTT